MLLILNSDNEPIAEIKSDDKNIITLLKTEEYKITEVKDVEVSDTIKIN